MESQFYSPADRAREKEASRAEDVRALEAGEKSAEQLREENALFAFSRVRIGVPVDER